MSKELEALKWIRGYEWTNPKLKEKLDIIETALKRLKTVEEENKLLKENNANLDDTYFDTWYACERLKESCDYALMFVDNVYCLVDTNKNKFDVIDIYKIKNHGIIDNGTQKKLKALEIIKEKRVNVEEFIEMFEDWKGITYEEWIIYYEENGYYIQGNEDFDYNRLTKEEYDLLKEVLL